uniref:NADH-ubiquinone oxidoreductase chain 6 n=1 Tax=Sinopoppia nigroflagella TaxID=2803872 RepID=A0A897G090_9HYME|nr:NADH dehydrogenase subunit 6 [Sinopoppia nigroflagella]QSF20074.2 NADH dehydrogenase subunit 6 [Sinopoppia nigroflagella]
MMKMILTLLMFNSNLFHLMKTPLSMGLILLTQTILISLFSGMLTINFWYSYTLFIIMLGGMLILFIYTSSLSPNQKFNFNKKFFLVNTLFMSLIILIVYKLKFNISMNNEIINSMNLEIEQNFLMKMSLNKLYNNPTKQIMILLINYLLVTLFIIVKIVNINMGPLRKNN